MVLNFNNAGPRKTRQPSFNKGLLQHPESRAALLTTWKECMDNPAYENWNAKVVAANQALQSKSDELTTHPEATLESYLPQTV